MSQCPKCNSTRVIPGTLGTDRKPGIFRPAGMRSFTVSADAGSRFTAAGVLACLDCGVVWGAVTPAKLEVFIKRHCRDTGSVPTSQCLKCSSNRLATGKIFTDHKPSLLPAAFEPVGQRFFTLALGATRFTTEAVACLDCGFAWASISPEKLRSFIQRKCDLTPDNAVAFEGAKPSSDWKEMWIGGIGVALIPIGYGVYCLYSGHAHLLRRHGPVLDVQGWEAAVLASAYIALGAFFHFHFFWGRHARLHIWSPRLKKAALLIFACGVGYMVLRRFF